MSRVSTSRTDQSRHVHHLLFALGCDGLSCLCHLLSSRACAPRKLSRQIWPGAFRSGMSRIRNGASETGWKPQLVIVGFMPASVRRPRHPSVPGQSWKRQILTGRATEGAHAKGQRATAPGRRLGICSSRFSA